MADRYIDLDEIQIYGPYASKVIRARTLGLVKEFDAGLGKLADEIDAATKAVGELIKSTRKSDAHVRAGTQEKGPVIEQSVRLLGRFSKHLDAHARGPVDRKTYFPEDGTAGGVGRSSARVLLAMGRIATELQDPQCGVDGKAEWTQQFQSLISQLAPTLEHSNNAKTERRSSTPELEAARQAWLNVYVAAKLGVESVLRLTGNLHMMSSVFYDLAVPSAAKVTEAPPEVPAPGAPATNG